MSQRKRGHYHRIATEVEDLTRHIFAEGCPFATRTYVQTCRCGATRVRFQTVDSATNVPHGKPEDTYWLDENGGAV